MTGPDETLWTAEEAAAATGGRADGAWSASSVSIDTRTIKPGALFVALKGDARDGHGFVGDAIEKGAAAALVARAPDGFAAPRRLLMVGDTLEGLRGLAAAARARLPARARVIGVTGSVGKTGAKEMLHTMLGAQGRVHAAEDSYNNHWGVPLTWARAPRDADHLVIEMGMNHAGEIAPLSRLSRPHVALITTVTAAHVGNFRDESGVADAKAEIFEGVIEGGAAVLNRDNRWHDRLAAAARARGLRVIAFGAGAGCDAQLVSAQIRGVTTVVEARIAGRDLVFKIGAPGRHLAMNAVGALAAAEAAGADLARAALALAEWRAPSGRGARWRVHVGPDGDGVIELIDESYNANPASVGAALEVLAAAPVEDGVGRIARGRRVACLGDMMELGDQEAALHAGLADHPALSQVDLVFTVGARMQALHAALPKARAGGWFPDSRAAADRLKRILDAGDVLMVKGSKTVQMGAVVRAVKSLGLARDASAPEDL